MHTALTRLETLRSLAANVTVLDPDGTVVQTNGTWRDPHPANGAMLPDGGRGLNYLSLCPPDRARRIEALIEGHCDLVTSVYPCQSSRDTRWMLLVATPLHDAAPRGATLLHLDLSSLLPLELGRDGLAAVHAPGDVPASTLEAIVHTIEDSIVRSLAGPAAIRSIAAAKPVAAVQRPADPVRDVVRGGPVPSVAAPPLPPVGVAASPPAGAIGPAPAVPAPTMPTPSVPVSIVDQLPRRQRQVFTLLGEGRSNGEIAEALGISTNTAKLHVAAVLRRLGLDNRMQAVAFAARITGEAG